MNTTASAVIEMATTSILNKGGTFAADGTQPTAGFAVTVAVMDTLDEMTLNNVEAYLPFVAEGNYLGTWFDHENGVWEISETVVFTDRDDALSIARMLDERYVYDLAEGAEIAVGQIVTS